MLFRSMWCFARRFDEHRDRRAIDATHSGHQIQCTQIRLPLQSSQASPPEAKMRMIQIERFVSLEENALGWIRLALKR